MTSRQMHYDLKQKLNKLDSQKYQGLKVPEIDWKLNEAQEVFVKIVAEPRLRDELGVEINQRTIDDIRTVVVDQKKGAGQAVEVYDESDSSYLATLPDDYWFTLNSKAYVTKGDCTGIRLKTVTIQHDDENELSPLYRSSFRWRVTNIRFNNEGIRIFTGNGDFTPEELCIEYIKQLPYIHNAQDFEDGSYELEGVTLTGSQDSILPQGVHREIVDLAVLIIAGDLSLPDYMMKKYKVDLTR